ncbi:hypothetical protein N0V83_005762 [Neocucurbitaria cava]|uniref:SCP domain-containing protein n=1 Tax=Neocucurbitaria cava TaxID=798079 RepID=A0A9W9CLY5_9PLEO|nr:hypothetical protein N0V83_005762 [Neocucurbitaria cava]
MLTSLLLTSVLVMGAMAMPQSYRRKGHTVTETEVVVTTLTVFVTEPYAEPTPTSSTSLHLSTSAPLEPTSTLVVSAPAYTPDPLPASTSSATGNLAPQSVPEPTSFEFVQSSSSIPTPTPAVVSQPQPQSQPSFAHDALRAASTSAATHITGTNEAYLSSGADYRAAVLYHHNAARANHNAAPLTWDSSCEANARITAQTCNFVHYIPQGAGQGQNLFTISGKAFNVTAGITENWYKGELEPMMPYFGQSNIPDNVFHEVGHLTQLVWKATTKVGCVSIDCGSKMIVGGQSSTMNKYTVCNYAPAGNVGGRYAVNVAAPDSLTSLGSWAD